VVAKNDSSSWSSSSAACGAGRRTDTPRSRRTSAAIRVGGWLRSSTVDGSCRIPMMTTINPA